MKVPYLLLASRLAFTMHLVILPLRKAAHMEHGKHKNSLKACGNCCSKDNQPTGCLTNALQTLEKLQLETVGNSTAAV